MDYELISRRIRQLASQRVTAGQEAMDTRDKTYVGKGGLVIGGADVGEKQKKSKKAGGLAIGGETRGKNPWAEFVTLFAESEGLTLHDVLMDHNLIRRLDKEYRAMTMSDKDKIKKLFAKGCYNREGNYSGVKYRDAFGGQDLSDLAALRKDNVKRNREKGARKNPWVKFLKQYERETGTPYATAMVDPAVRRLYKQL